MQETMNIQNSKHLKSNSVPKRKRRGLLSTLFSRRKTQIPASCGEKSDTPIAEGYTSIHTVSCIKDLPLRDFISCQVDGNLQVLGKGSETGLQAAWMRLLSEFYVTSGNTQAARYIELIAGMEAIKFRAAYIDFLLSSISECYTEEIAQRIRDEHPDLQFTRETYPREITYVQNKEKRHKMEYDNLKAEFDKLESGNTNKETKRLDYIEQLLDINKQEHATYTEEMSTETFALCIKRLERHYKMLEEQARKG